MLKEVDARKPIDRIDYPVQVAGKPSPGQIIIEIVLFIRAFTDVAHVAIGIDVVNESKPALARSVPISLLVQPAILHAGNHRKRKHAG